MNNKVILGVIFAAISAFMLASMSLFSKLLSSYLGPIEVTFFRNVFSFIALLLWILCARKLAELKTGRPWAHIIRGVIGTTGIVVGMWALSIMPLTETTILLFTSPLFVVLLSYPILKEKVGPYRLSAVLIGFIGVFITVSPFSSHEPLPILGIILALIWGFESACVYICLRWMGNTETSTRTVFYFVLFGTLATSVHLPFAEVKAPLSFDMLWIIVGLGATGLISLLCKTQSLRLAEASIIAPIMYTMIIWAFVFDYLLWDKEPTINNIAGAGLIIFSNMLILYREQKKKQKTV
tara:strand:+ start:431 stop:1315 length:885 start_codon:yes stop_codon:yes gene_type:complete